MKLWQQVLSAVGLGIIVGFLVPQQAVHLKILGDAFLRLIHMIILPLVFSSVCLGVTSIHDPKKLGRIGAKTILLYAVTTLISVALGIAAGGIFEPGSGLHFSAVTNAPLATTLPSLGELLLNAIPTNPVKAFVDGNVLQVLIFSILFGLSMGLIGEKAEPLEKLIRALAEGMYQLTNLVIKLSPIGVFGQMAWVAATFGVQALIPLGSFLAIYYGICIFHVGVVFSSLLLWVKVSPKKIYFAAWDAAVMAFSTCSSAATLPVALDCVINKLHIRPAVANFMLPLGTTINMNGAAIFQGLSALFLSQAYGISLTFEQLITVVAVSTLSAIGAAGIPGTGFLMLSIVLTSAGIPIEGLAFLAGIDRIREMMSTVLNVLGDIVCTVVVAKQEGQIDEIQECLPPR